MTVAALYERFEIPKNLQMHMTRVAAVAQMITAAWTGPAVDDQAILTTCLLHDIAKPMTFDLSKQARFGMTDQQTQALADLQKRLKKTYGESEHVAVVAISKEVQQSEIVSRLLDDFEWENVPRLLEENELNALIPLYADMRVAPNAVVSLEERFADLAQREPGKKELLQSLEQAASRLESMLQANTSMRLDTLSLEQVQALGERLFNNKL